jgi:uracil-DNA glycosylase family 4
MNLTEEKQQKLTKVAEEVKKCTRCDLYKEATKAVPGEGNPQAEVMFIGEGPGFWEDKQGLPFVGQAGKLLDQLLVSINLPRKEVFIGNVIKHRPPGNRDPLPEEIKACEPYLDEQIKTIDPRIIVTLGRFSLNKFLPGEYISKIHGQARFIDFAAKKRIIIPMYHPAAALRSAIIKGEIETDFKKIREFLEKKQVKEERKEKKEEQIGLFN